MKFFCFSRFKSRHGSSRRVLSEIPEIVIIPPSPSPVDLSQRQPSRPAGPHHLPAPQAREFFSRRWRMRRRPVVMPVLVFVMMDGGRWQEGR